MLLHMFGSSTTGSEEHSIVRSSEELETRRDLRCALSAARGDC